MSWLTDWVRRFVRMNNRWDIVTALLKLYRLVIKWELCQLSVLNLRVDKSHVSRFTCLWGILDLISIDMQVGLVQLPWKSPPNIFFSRMLARIYLPHVHKINNTNLTLKTLDSVSAWTAPYRRFRCYLGTAPRAQYHKMSAWLFHLNWRQGSTCPARKKWGCTCLKLTLLASHWQKNGINLAIEQ